MSIVPNSIVTPRSTGLAVVLVSTLLWSLVGLFVRMADADLWSIIVWRSVFAALALGPFWLLATGNKAEALRATFSKPGMITIGLAVSGNIAYIAAVQLTSVATVMTVYATLPFITAALGFLLLAEPLNRRFGAAAALATLGIVITSGAAMAMSDAAGIAVSLVMTLSWAGLLVQAKKHPALDLTLISVLSALGAALVALPLLPAGLPSLHMLWVCALLGVLTSGLANVLTLMGGRHIRSGETGLLLLLDVVLSPLWVWLAFDERVDPATLFGGALVVIAVAGYLFADMMPRRAVRCPAP
ncbi:DMT family transporter [Ancylobacter rudongensis]|uniref:EamA domain-containing membrane protein RarD n=1 Tax=Ancylobacter rudongensis TaxID=177413 RepID=A0A1G4T7G5_9HYPH|nr:DMT family transporter [Ancylobacter rudongensis]SCW77231.1 EamA domain-containing membrane protein RarD [Ancylobacter rudongensis]